MRSSLLFPRINRHTRVLPTHLNGSSVNADPVVRCVPPSESLVEFGAYVGGEKIAAAISAVVLSGDVRREQPFVLR